MFEKKMEIRDIEFKDNSEKIEPEIVGQPCFYLARTIDNGRFVVRIGVDGKCAPYREWLAKSVGGK